MPKPADQLQGKKTEIDFANLDKHIKDKAKQKIIKDKYEKIKHLIRADLADPMIDDVTGAVEIVAHTPRRQANGLPPMRIINPSLEAALSDIATLGLEHGASR